MDYLQITGSDTLTIYDAGGDTLTLVDNVIVALGEGGGAVSSVNGQSGAVTLTYYDVQAESYSNAQNQYSSINAALETKVTQVALDYQLLSYATVTNVNTALSLKADLSALNDKADLVGGVVPTSQLPAIAITEFLGDVPNQAAMLALTGQSGDWCIRTDSGTTYVITSPVNTGLLSDWTALPQPTVGVTSVNGQSGTVVLGYADVNAEPAGAVATAQAALQTQIDLKADSAATLQLLDLKADKTGNIATATKLLNARTIALSGAVSGSALFDGSGNVTIATTSSGGIVWANITKVPAAIAFGFASDGLYPMQIGKDAEGNVYIRGVFRNTGATTLTGLIDLLASPSSHKFRTIAGSQHNVLSTASIYYFDRDSGQAASNARYLTVRSSATVNYFGLLDIMPAGAVIVVPFQCIGFLE